MQSAKYSIEKVAGNTGADAWCATVDICDCGVRVHLKVGGENATLARAGMGYALKNLEVQIQEAKSNF